MDVVILIGRILFGAVFIGGALGHFTQTAYLAGYAQSKGIRPGRAAVLLAGGWMLVGAALVALGAWADLGALMLVAFLLPTAFIMHPFWRETDQQVKAGEQIQFNKDISLAGAALALFGFFAAFGDHAGLQLTGPLFDSLAGGRLGAVRADDRQTRLAPTATALTAVVAGGSRRCIGGVRSESRQLARALRTPIQEQNAFYTDLSQPIQLVD